MNALKFILKTLFINNPQFDLIYYDLLFSIIELAFNNKKYDHCEKYIN